MKLWKKNLKKSSLPRYPGYPLVFGKNTLLPEYFGNAISNFLIIIEEDQTNISSKCLIYDIYVNNNMLEDQTRNGFL